MASIKPQTYRDHSKGTWRDIQNSQAPRSSHRLAMNMNSDKEYGSLVTRDGTTLMNQLEAGKPCLGLHNFRDSVGTDNKLLAIFSDGSNNIIYDAITGNTIPAGGAYTKDLKARFLTYLDACLLLVGEAGHSYYVGGGMLAGTGGPTGCTVSVADDDFTDAGASFAVNDILIFSTADTLPAPLTLNTKYYVVETAAGGTECKVSLTYGGAVVNITDLGAGQTFYDYWDPFDISNVPDYVKYAIEFRDRVYVAGDLYNPDTLYYSGIADSDARTVSWTAGNGEILIEQEDGGGGITALTKVPGYMLIFKKWTMKRWDGVSTYPDDLVNQGVPTQECVCTGRGSCLFINEKGIWVTNGGYPKKLSKWTVDSFVDAITDWSTVCAFSDDRIARFSIGDVTVDGVTYNNVTIKYSHDTQSFDLYSYPDNHVRMTLYVDSNDERFVAAGDDDGNVKKLDTGNDDDGTPITYEYESHDIDFGKRHFLKQIQRAMFYSKNMTLATVLVRTDSDREEDFKTIGKIASPLTEIEGINIISNYFHIKIVGQTDAGNVKLLGYAFPDNIKVLKNTKK